MVVEPIGTWICYLMHQVVQRYHDQKGLEDGAALLPSWRVDQHLKINLGMHKKIMQIKIAERIFKREYDRIIEALGGIGHHLVDQYELQRLGHPYYNSRRRAAKATWKSPRISTTRRRVSRTWCWLLSLSDACPRRNPTARSRR